MPNEARSMVDSVPSLQAILREGWRFDFCQVVWLLEGFRAAESALGERGPVSGEAILFRPDASMGFPPADVRRVTALRERGGAPKFQIDVTFMGLYGVCSPLPLHYAVDILRAAGPDAVASSSPPAARPAGPELAEPTVDESSPVRDFLDIFHHRLISLFYRSWRKYRYDVAFGAARGDRFTDYLLWLIGLGPDVDVAVLGLSPIRLLRYAGALTQHPRSSTTLEGVVSDYWGGMGVTVEQFVGRWVPVSAADANRLGATNSRLGTDLIVGAEVYDLSGAFNVAVGPMDWATFQRFLPDGPGFTQTMALVRLYCCDPLSFTIEAKLEARQVPPLCLRSDDGAARLGYTSWVRTIEMAETSAVFGEREAA